ncbi:MAG: heparan-alpha-glucosaminide N-acetyltransferase domain-containing protein [Ferruginibacter sp.]
MAADEKNNIASGIKNTIMHQSLTRSKRIESIDLLRGLIMIIMALDHTRDFFHKDGLTGDPLDPETTTSILYFTRWITHFCAPTFVFLSGLSAWLQSQRKTKKELSIFLISRGFWLIFVDLTIMSLGLTANIHFSFFVLETLWSIGASMVILGLVIRLPFNLILALGLLIFFGHNLLDFAEQARAGNVPVWWSLLHRVSIVPLWGNHSLFIFYPFLSWTGLMLLGYCCGKLFTDTSAERRKKILLTSGISAVLFFVALRWANFYGDPRPWVEQKTGLKTFFAFMNVQKYPPSLLFLCATVGPGLIFLALAKNTGSKLVKIISVYGRVPFFYFIVHFYILHIATAIVYLSRGHSIAEGMAGLPGLPFKFAMPGEGFSLPAVYGIWAAIVIIMYPLCKWYDNYKTNHKEKWWLSYL